MTPKQEEFLKLRRHKYLDLESLAKHRGQPTPKNEDFLQPRSLVLRLNI